MHKTACALTMILMSVVGTSQLSAAGKTNEGQNKWVRNFVQEHARNLVFVKDREGKGSGFLCRYRGQDVLLTNIHVIAGMQRPEYIRVNGGAMNVGLAATAVGHDVMCFGVQPIEWPLEVMEQIEEEVGIGDDILVIGNTSGADVALPLYGQILAIGPNLIEINAPILPGNSGSPIIHRKSGKIIGIATHLMRKPKPTGGDKEDDEDDEEKKGSKESSRPIRNEDPRRFGTRLDSIKEWQKVEWGQFRREAAQYKRIISLSQELQQIVFGIKDRGITTLLQSKNPDVYSAGERYVRTMKNPKSTRNDFLVATENLADDMKATCRSDVLNAKNSFRIDFFRARIEEELPFRQEIADIFEQVSKGISLMK